MRRILLSACGLAFLLACNPQGFHGGGQQINESADATGKGSKPSDESEGVPGYLTDPASVSASSDGGTLKVRGGANAVAAAGSTPLSGLLVAYWDVTSDGLAQALAGQGDAGGKLLGQVPVNADGSFVFAPGSLPSDDELVIAVVARGATPKLPLGMADAKHYRAAVLNDPADGGPFQGISVASASGPLAGVDLGALLDVPLAAQWQIRTCLGQLYGNNVDAAQLGHYRRLQSNGLLTAGDTLTDQDSGQPEIVHVGVNGLTVTNMQIKLLNPKATYCLDVHALSFSASTITINCKAHFYDDSSSLVQLGVQIQKTTGC